MELLIKMKRETNDAFWAFRSGQQDIKIPQGMWRVSPTFRMGGNRTGVVISHGCEN